MIPYFTPFVTGIFGILFAWVDARDIKRLAFVYFAGIAIFFIGLRGNIDVDYSGYLNAYSELPDVFDFEIAKGDFLYKILSALFRSLGFQYAWFVFFTTAVSISIKGYIITKLCKSPLTALSVYLCIAFIETEMITVRWAIATSLLILSIHFLYLNRRYLAFIIFLCALGFHSFVFIYALAAPLLFIKNTKFYIFAALGALIVGAYLPMASIYESVMLFQVDAYTLQKIQSYTSQDMNPIGIFSALKVLFLLTIWIIASTFGGRVNWSADESVRNIFRPAFLFLAISLLLYNYKVFYYRAAVVVDFYLILLAVNSVDLAFRANHRAAIYSFFIAMFIVWSLFDINNHYMSGYIKYYEFAPLF